MGERLFEANGLNNDHDFLHNTHHGEPRRTQPEVNEPPKSTRDHVAKAICKWFGVNPIQNEKNNKYTIPQPPNRRDPGPSKEEERMGTNESHEIDGSQLCSAFHQTDTRKSITSIREPGRLSHTPENENMHWASVEPPNLIDEDEGQNYSSSILVNESANLIAKWKTPSDELSIDGRRDNMLTTSDSSQSLSYFTTASHLTTQSWTDDNYTFDIEMNDSHQMSEYEETNEIEARIMKAMERELQFEWALPTQHVRNNEYDWEEDETTPITPPNGYKYKTISRFFKPKDKKDDTNETMYETNNSTTNEMKEHTQAGEENAVNQNETPDKPDDTTTNNNSEMLDLDEPNTPTTNERIEKSLQDENIVAIEMVRLIRACGKQLLNPWKTKTEYFDGYINHLGYGHKITRLICIRLYMVQRISVAVELAALLRRCSYPKRDVIRWN